jgi:hypothetical protein
MKLGERRPLIYTHGPAVSHHSKPASTQTLFVSETYNQVLSKVFHSGSGSTFYSFILGLLHDAIV